MIFNRPILNKISIFVFFFCFAFTYPILVNAQIKGVIIEKDSKLPIAFASIAYQKYSIRKGVITDFVSL